MTSERENASLGAVVDEGGFEGAVRIVDRWQDDSGWGHMTAAIPYLDVCGEVREGQARLYFTADLFASGDALPAYVAAFYPVDEMVARELCGLGFVVISGFYEECALEFPFGNGQNLMKGMLQWARRLPCIDRKRLLVGGGSAGGHMALWMGAEVFPVSGIVAGVPAINHAYGFSYFLANRESSGSTLPPEAERLLPVLAQLIPLVADDATALFGADMSAPVWYNLSPVSFLDRIGAPTLVTCATGDMLCPIEIFTARRFGELERERFTDDYERDFDALTLDLRARRRFDEIVPADELFVRVLPRPEGLHEFTADDIKDLDGLSRLMRESPEIDLPWSEEKRWSLVILDEGAPLPHTGHMRCAWNVTPRGFIARHRDLGLGRTELKAAMMKRLMERYARHPTDGVVLADGTPANQLNFVPVEKLDVVSGLLDYAQCSETHARRVEELYAGCAVQPFGPRLSLKELRAAEAELRGGLR